MITCGWVSLVRMMRAWTSLGHGVPARLRGEPVELLHAGGDSVLEVEPRFGLPTTQLFPGPEGQREPTQAALQT